jgi:asparagine synthase (glutamine-hydrolysing)
MSGLAGIYGKNPNRDELNLMIERIAYRGGAIVNQASAGDRSFILASLSNECKTPLCDLGLSTSIDLGHAARIAFDGRIFNRRELQEELAEIDSPKEELDSELVLRLYTERGPDCFVMLDGIFALAITDPKRGLVLARDRMGGRPLYTGRQSDCTYFASEFKAFSGLLDEYINFPPGYWQQVGGEMIQFAPTVPEIGEPINDLAEATAGVLELLRAATAKRLRVPGPTGIFLSGGLDSSLLAALVVEQLPGIDSFAVGVEGSDDLEYARICAEYLGTKHHEFVYNAQDMAHVVDEVIRVLETYDAPLVRSSIPNYFLARLASGHVNTVLSGEGADELFAGYSYLLGLSSQELRREMLSAVTNMNRLGLQRSNRMSSLFGLEVLIPFLDKDLIEFALRINPELNFGPEGEEKWVLRTASSALLPEEVIYRPKQKFSRGAGSAKMMAGVSSALIDDIELESERRSEAGNRLRGKEELMYYRIFKRYYPELAAEKTLSFSQGY